MESAFSLLIRLIFNFRLNRIERSIRWDLFYKHSFRIPGNLERSWRSIPAFFKKSFLLIFNDSKQDILNAEILVLDTDPIHEELRRSYLNVAANKSVKFLFRRSLPNRLSRFSQSILVLKIIMTGLVLLPNCLFAKNRGKKMHILVEFVECELLLRALKDCVSKKIYVFGSFEKHSSFEQILLKRSSFESVLIPSSNPLLYYRTVIANTFVFTAAYQVFEYEKLKDNWDVDSFLKWPPSEYDKIPCVKQESVTSFSLGFMSSGMHLREALGHPQVGNGSLNRAESKMISMLQIGLEEKVFTSLVICLHPLEKRNKVNLEISTNHYREIFGEKIVFSPFDQSSRDSFTDIEVAIAGFSSVLMERLYGGHKVIFAPMNELNNFYSDSRLDRISVDDIEAFRSVFLRILHMDSQEYLETFKLEDYYHENIGLPEVM